MNAAINPIFTSVPYPSEYLVTMTRFFPQSRHSSVSWGQTDSDLHSILIHRRRSEAGKLSSPMWACALQNEVYRDRPGTDTLPPHSSHPPMTGKHNSRLSQAAFVPSVSVLGMKRSNIITIALSSLPAPRLLPPAIYAMDSSVLDREDVQRLRALIPTEDELGLIKEAKAQNPHAPLAQAELCLLTLGEIPHLSTRLELWAFALDYDSLEKEIAEPLFHLKLAMEQLAASQTFRYILATVLTIGNFLNGCKARGFELSYLSKLSQVRDTHTRQPLLHHVCLLLLQLRPDSSDLHSDIAAVTKAAKYDYSQVQSSFTQLETMCKASWEQLKILEKAEDRQNGGKMDRSKSANEEVSENSLRHRLPKILKDCEERLKVLRAVHRRVINRFHSFLLFLGYSHSMVRDTKAEDFCRNISNFSLEYRNARQAIILQRERDQQKAVAGIPAPGTPVGRRKCQQEPSQDSDEQCRLEKVLRTPELSSRVDITVPQSRRRTGDIKGVPCKKMTW
uniref:FH2 domain-containing protein n=1 Tax=Oryzias latipes TaxID=8090 RepID=A0A3P9L9J0_ORYLA